MACKKSGQEVCAHAECAEIKNKQTHKDEFSYHEVLDRTSIIADLWDEQIFQHEAMKGEPEMKEEAEKICELLHQFYQEWGSIRARKF